MKILFKQIDAQEQKDRGINKYFLINLGAFGPIITPVMVFLGILLVTFSFKSVTDAKKMVTCDAFKTQIAAQTLFESNKIKYDYLDKNHDGIACNKLLKIYAR